MVGSDKFLAHGAVQNYLTDVWKVEIKSTESNLKVGSFIFLSYGEMKNLNLSTHYQLITNSL